MAKGKLKMLYLLRIFCQETDDEHALTLQEIADRLEAVGIAADRKTLYADFEELRQFGFDIISQHCGRSTLYHLGQREFQLPEMKLLVDSVQAAKFITDRKSRELIRKLETHVSRYQAEQLNRQVVIAGRVKTMNESIYYNIDRLHEAINADTRVRFQYVQWNIDKQLVPRRGGDWYRVSPWALVWNDDNYYLLAYDAEADMIKHYRVDKMKKIRPLGLPRQGAERFREIDLARYSAQVFRMFTGEERTVTLACDNAMAGVIIDRFGKDVSLSPLDGGRFCATVNVAVSPQFLGWLMALGAGVRVTGPEDVVRRIRDRLQELTEIYE